MSHHKENFTRVNSLSHSCRSGPQGPARLRARHHVSPFVIKARVSANSNDKMAQTAMVSQVQRNSQRGVGTACQSRVGSHSQGCHWRKRLESCVETERDKDRRERERKEGKRIKKRGKQG